MSKIQSPESSEVRGGVIGIFEVRRKAEGFWQGSRNSLKDTG